MKKKIIIIPAILFALVLGGYLYVRYAVLKSKDFKPVTSSSRSIIDLRPALIARLQQLVQDGSNGLYKLQIAQIEPSVTTGTVDVTGIKLQPDSAVLAHLDSLQLAPDDVYYISIKTLFIAGLGIQNLLSSKSIDLKSIILNEPVIDIFHKERKYNAGKRMQRDSASLYSKLTKQLNSIAITKIEVKNAFVTNHDISQKNKITRYSNISVQMKQLLVDASTQYDSSRFLFARSAQLSLQKYVMRTPDSLYFFKCAAVSISATDKSLTASGIELVPRFGKDDFQRHLKFRQDRYDIKAPKIVLSGIDWWSVANSNKLIAKQADMYDLSFSDYIDRSLPLRPLRINNFPHQEIMKLKLPVDLPLVRLHNMHLDYAEFNPLSGKRGKIYFEDIAATIENVTNIPANVKKKSAMTFKATAMFLNKTPATVQINFNLAKVKSGAFTADVHIGAVDNILLNPVAEPLGLFSLKSGNVKEGTIHVYGDNYRTHGDLVMLYEKLNLVPLKKDDDKKGGLKKQKVLGLLANFLFIKNANPGKSGEVRKESYEVARLWHPNFFNQLWKTLLAGIIKSIGAPDKFAK